MRMDSLGDRIIAKQKYIYERHGFFKCSSFSRYAGFLEHHAYLFPDHYYFFYR
jgi:hypothetical protein